MKSVAVVVGALTIAAAVFGSTQVVARQAPGSVSAAGDVIRYRSGDAEVIAFMARPGGGGRHAGAIIVHDNRGLDAHARAMAERLAAAGFVALVPDLLSRAGGSDRFQAPAQMTAAINRIPLFDFTRDLGAAFALLKERSDVDPARISVIGIGWGGWRAMTLASTTPTLYRVVVYSGATPMDGLEQIQAPVLAHYGGFDFRNSAAAIWTSKRIKRFSYHVYPSAVPASFDETSRRYDRETADAAWARTLEFLQAP